MRKVINQTSINKIFNGFPILHNKTSLIRANNKTVAILIKLFAINIVANNLFGSLSNFWVSFICLEVCSSSDSSCSFVKEKKATSAPEINPDAINKKTNEAN